MYPSLRPAAAESIEVAEGAPPAAGRWRVPAGPGVAAGQLQCRVRPRPAPRTTPRHRSPRARAGTLPTEARLVARSSVAPLPAGARAARARGEHEDSLGRGRETAIGSSHSAAPPQAPPAQDSVANGVSESLSPRRRTPRGNLRSPNRRTKRSLGVRGNELGEPAESERSTGVRTWKLRWRGSGEPVRREETF